MRIEQSTSSTAGDLLGAIETPVKQASALENAAEELAREFHSRFAESARGAADLKTATPVLSLIATHGHEENWNDRKKSKDHVGIPLISSAFVGAIPMIARLIKELGVPLEWVDRHDSEMIICTMGTSAGLFFVDDAGEATDHQGRKIIAAQDFVSSYNVKSVFGIGGAYPSGQILLVVVFRRDTLSRTTAERFLALTNLFISQMSGFAEPAKVFVNDPACIRLLSGRLMDEVERGVH